MFKLPFYIVTFALLLKAGETFAQFWKKSDEKAFKEPIVRIYPYENGVQFIEIDQIQTWESYTSYLDAMNPRGSSYKVDIPTPTMNVYIFRDEHKQVFKAYNTFESLESLTERFYDFNADSVAIENTVKLDMHHFFGSSDPIKSLKNQAHYLIYSIPEIYDLAPFRSNTIKSNKIGIIDNLGNEIIPPTYQHIELFEHGFLARNETHFGLLNFQLDTLLPFRFSHFRYLPDKGEILLFENNLITKIYRPSNHHIYEVEFSDVVPLKDYRYSSPKPEKVWLAHRNYSYQIIDSTYAPINQEAYEFMEAQTQFDLIRVVKNNRWGLINSKGEEIVPCRFNDIWIINKDSSIVKFDINYHWVNHFGKVLDVCQDLPFQIKQGNHYNVFKRGQYYGINNGPLIYTHVRKVKDSVYIVQRNKEKFGLVNENGQLLSDSYYHSIHPLNENRNFVTMNRTYTQRDGYFYSQSYYYQETYGAILNDFAHTIPCIYQQIDAVPHDGLMLFKINDRYGFMDATGNIVIPNQFKKAYSFNNGLALIGNDSTYGFINTKGNLIIDTIYQSLGYSNYGMIMAKKEDKFGVIDKDEKTIIPFEYENLMILSDHYLKVQKDGKWGLINTKNKVKIDFEYDWVSEIIWDKYVKVQQNGKIGVITLNGNLVFPCQFDQIISWSANTNMHIYQIRVIDKKGTYWVDLP